MQQIFKFDRGNHTIVEVYKMIDHDCVVNVYNILDWKHLIKFFFASVFHTSNFPMLFSGLMALVPVQENSSVNPTIMFSKLFYWFGVLLYEKCWHMFVEVAGHSFRKMFINNYHCVHWCVVHCNSL